MTAGTARDLWGGDLWRRIRPPLHPLMASCAQYCPSQRRRPRAEPSAGLVYRFDADATGGPARPFVPDAHWIHWAARTSSIHAPAAIAVGKPAVDMASTAVRRISSSVRPTVRALRTLERGVPDGRDVLRLPLPHAGAQPGAAAVLRVPGPRHALAGPVLLIHHAHHHRVRQPGPRREPGPDLRRARDADRSAVPGHGGGQGRQCLAAGPGQDCAGTPATNDVAHQAGGAEPGDQNCAGRRVAIPADFLRFSGMATSCSRCLPTRGKLKQGHRCSS